MISLIKSCLPLNIEGLVETVTKLFISPSSPQETRLAGFETLPDEATEDNGSEKSADENCSSGVDCPSLAETNSAVSDGELDAVPPRVFSGVDLGEVAAVGQTNSINPPQNFETNYVETNVIKRTSENTIWSFNLDNILETIIHLWGELSLTHEAPCKYL